MDTGHKVQTRRPDGAWRSDLLVVPNTTESSRYLTENTPDMYIIIRSVHGVPGIIEYDIQRVPDVNGITGRQVIPYRYGQGVQDLTN
jgi:hypothetical protein